LIYSVDETESEAAIPGRQDVEIELALVGDWEKKADNY
jgi:hypothetical protein